MGGLDGRNDAQHRLEAEIANDDQWVVFDDPHGEDAWEELELTEITVAAAWWVCVHA
jgi:hypothetical protein